jgi:tyrosyl-tRNA synthetase
MLGRNIQKDFGVSQQVPLFVPLLEGIDGVEKMSKSLGNYIGINEPANVMYEKAMKIPDNLIIRYYELTTDEHPDKIEEVKRKLASGVNPRDLKMELARTIVGLYHSAEDVKNAEEYFVSTYQKNVVSKDTPVLTCDAQFINDEGKINLIDLIFSSNKFNSKGEIRRLILGSALKIDGEKFQELTLDKNEDFVIQLGKGTMYQVKYEA